MSAPWDPLHDDALEAGAPVYVDPVTGYLVTTAAGHRARGWCCGSGCRHCPWEGELDPPRPGSTSNDGPTLFDLSSRDVDPPRS
jgi:hypothetical protein